jgi:hypothetical protein
MHFLLRADLIHPGRTGNFNKNVWAACSLNWFLPLLGCTHFVTSNGHGFSAICQNHVVL